MKTGIVRFYNVDKNYGFITADDGSGETFVHISRIRKAGLETLASSQKISYLVKLDGLKDKNYATMLSLIPDSD
jgi:CspA family cold shock protein